MDICFHLIELFTWWELDYGDSIILIIELFLMSAMNLALPIILKKKYVDEFCLSEHVIFTIIIPCTSSAIMYYLVKLISTMMSALNVGFNIV